ncbi:hypothetical protein RRG08_001702 [Elysia crispata]|uniref:Uncharacterized protein n=1 Tax=Elysia crispata TaxID=231223 RepID=A0AAE1AM90_9GAST|nr:hypothetical protein RRG08_001702 [Elysia crispata]
MVVGTVHANRIGLPKDLIQQPVNREKFLRNLCYSLAPRGNTGRLAQQVAPVQANNLDRLTGRHFPVLYDEQEGKKRGYCVVYYARLARLEQAEMS